MTNKKENKTKIHNETNLDDLIKGQYFDIVFHISVKREQDFVYGRTLAFFSFAKLNQ